MGFDEELYARRQQSRLTYLRKRVQSVEHPTTYRRDQRTSESNYLGPSTYDKASSTANSQRIQLPIEYYKNELLDAVKAHDVLILVGETGSGKTTQLPQYLVEGGYQRVVCMQPRRVAAISVALRVAEEIKCKIGDAVGYAVRFEDCTSNLTRIKYMTDGLLLREILSDPYLSNYDVIMVDEAHERTLNTDILMALLKELVRVRLGLKLIISSATLEVDKFSDFFDGAPVFSVPGRRHPVDIFYSSNPEPDYLGAALKTIVQIHLFRPEGDILVFLTGQEEIEFLQDCLERFCESTADFQAKKLIVAPVFSNLPTEQQSLIFRKTSTGFRKVVIATNIAETSITIENICFVIDCGLVKQKHYNPQNGVEALIITPTSRASADQRAGRAGRTAPGICYRLYTSQSFIEEMKPNNIPEIQRSNLCNILLMLKAIGVTDILNFNYIDRPDPWLLLKGIEDLYSLGAIDIDGNITKIGQIICEFPLEPRLSKALITSSNYCCSLDVISIISIISAQGSLFISTRRDRLSAEKAKRRFWDPKGDILTLLNVWNAWETENFSKQWCIDNFINFRTLQRAKDIRGQLVQLASKSNICKQVSGTSDADGILKSFLAGFFNQVAQRKEGPTGEYRTSFGIIAGIHPTSSMFGMNHEWVVFLELLLTSKQFIRNVSVIEINWINEVAPQLFKLSDLMHSKK